MNLFKQKYWEGNPAKWGGGDVADAVTLPKPQVRSERLAPRPVLPARDGFLAEYAELAALVGIASPDSNIEAFKDFMRQKDWAIFSLAEVISYMDKKALAESKEQSGWEWRPLRDSDHGRRMAFGRGATRDRNNFSNQVITPASDFYIGPYDENFPDRSTGLPRSHSFSSRQSVYDKTIPLHALRKIAAIEREFKAAKVHFFVCDYALAPAIQHPDPFLMAVIDNPKLASGTGRFIIDFWDEPGFGMEQMMK